MYFPVTWLVKTKKIEFQNWHNNFPCNITVSSDTEQNHTHKTKTEDSLACSFARKQSYN